MGAVSWKTMHGGRLHIPMARIQGTDVFPAERKTSVAESFRQHSLPRRGRRHRRKYGGPRCGHRIAYVGEKRNHYGQNHKLLHANHAAVASEGRNPKTQLQTSTNLVNEPLHSVTVSTQF